jgi:8-oxo-dGTP diphosphatase
MAQYFYITLGLIIKAQGKVLILHKNKTSDNKKLDIWTLPRGKINEGETEFECLRREVKEELNIDISQTNPKFVGYYLDSNKTFTNNNAMLAMKYQIDWPEIFEVKLDKEHDNYKWIDYEEFIETNLHAKKIPVNKMLLKNN